MLIIDKIWPIMESSFPYNERRTFEDQKKIFNRENFFCKTYEQGNDLLGFITYWDFGDFIYVEHLASNKKFRGKGLGGKILDELKAFNKLIVLEVEPPNKHDIFTLKRIGFYERNGFLLNEYHYIQPPLNPHSNETELKIMTYPNLIDNKTMDLVRETLYNNVYIKIWEMEN